MDGEIWGSFVDKGCWNPTQRKKGKQVYLGECLVHPLECLLVHYFLSVGSLLCSWSIWHIWKCGLCRRLRWRRICCESLWFGSTQVLGSSTFTNFPVRQNFRRISLTCMHPFSFLIWKFELGKGKRSFGCNSCRLHNCRYQIMRRKSRLWKTWLERNIWLR